MVRRGARRARTIVRTVTRRARGSRRATTYLLKKTLKGALIGTGTSILLTQLGRYTNQPWMREAGQRVGSIAATYFGGTPGNVGYQAMDAAFDRFVNIPQLGGPVSGTQEVYL